MVIVVDRYYVHHLRMVPGMGPFRDNVGGRTIFGLGERVRLTADDFKRRADAFFADLEDKFV